MKLGNEIWEGKALTIFLYKCKVVALSAGLFFDPMGILGTALVKDI